ncbi:hypothetical protein C4565_01820 [Candidatus Parcubacteria bacterium]|jgi:hypothetical protein|nr:MAG: hypothetical protein C4565_01820 [Candidatus Parcubacteria bacterium]
MGKVWKINKEKCNACKKPYTNKLVRAKTKHHIYPRRFFPNSEETIELCRKCHGELEQEIPAKKRLSKQEYKNILETFIKRKQEEF